MSADFDLVLTPIPPLLTCSDNLQPRSLLDDGVDFGQDLEGSNEVWSQQTNDHFSNQTSLDPSSEVVVVVSVTDETHPLRFQCAKLWQGDTLISGEPCRLEECLLDLRVCDPLPCRHESSDITQIRTLSSILLSYLSLHVFDLDVYSLFLLLPWSYFSSTLCLSVT